ncbi:hypothetical protein ACFLS9_03455 [Bacteroidota bacterium]
MEGNQIQEDIHFIKKMIENNRRTLVDNGIMFISTGVYVFVGSTISYILGIYGKVDLLPVLWICLMAILIVFNLIIQRKAAKEQTKKTFSSKIFSATWSACGIPIVIIAVLFFTTGKGSPQALFVSISSILGIGYFLTGVINDLKFMKVLAFGWWVGTVLSFLWEYIGEEYQLSLLFAVLIFVLEIFPGIIIYKKWKRIYNE